MMLPSNYEPGEVVVGGSDASSTPAVMASSLLPSMINGSSVNEGAMAQDRQLLQRDSSTISPPHSSDRITGSSARNERRVMSPQNIANNNNIDNSKRSSSNNITSSRNSGMTKEDNHSAIDDHNNSNNNINSIDSERIRKFKKDGLDAMKFNDTMVYLDGPSIYTCCTCRTHLSSHDNIISKSFHGKHGRAYLFDNNSVVNITIGIPEERRLITGLHSVSDISCKRCSTVIGWTYNKAYETSQKYKEGKYIIEKIHLQYDNTAYANILPPAGLCNSNIIS